MVSALRIMHDAIVAASFALPPFQTYFSIATDSSSPSSFISKFVKIMIISVVGDILPNFIFDSVAVCVHAGSWNGETEPKTFQASFLHHFLLGMVWTKLERARSAQEARITRVHIDAMLELCGTKCRFFFTSYVNTSRLAWLHWESTCLRCKMHLNQKFPFTPERKWNSMAGKLHLRRFDPISIRCCSMRIYIPMTELCKCIRLFCFFLLPDVFFEGES